MDFVKNLAGGDSENTQADTGNEQSQRGGGFMDKLNSAAGGGRESEKNEDYLDKGLTSHNGTISFQCTDVLCSARNRLCTGKVHGPRSSG